MNLLALKVEEVNPVAFDTSAITRTWLVHGRDYTRTWLASWTSPQDLGSGEAWKATGMTGNTRRLPGLIR